MSDKKFIVFSGKFLCHTCKEEVKSLRLWIGTARTTWMCTQKHVSEVYLVRSKKDFMKAKNE
jgi:hypothetical protein